MKRLLPTFIRIACLLIVLQAIMACDKLQKTYEERNDSELAKAKYLQTLDIPQIGAVCHLSTSWREDRLYYIFTANPSINPKASPENKITKGSFARSLEYGFGGPIFTAKLLDRAGFEILSIGMKESIRVVDNDSKALGLQQKSNIDCSRKKYQDISRWEIVWRD
jgi:hypothetical protein